MEPGQPPIPTGHTGAPPGEPRPGRGPGWAPQVQVPSDLAGMRGPADGLVHLPGSVYASGAGQARGFNLADEGERIEFYEIVLTYGTADNITSLLDIDELTRLWSRLWLPPHVRQAWAPHIPATMSERPDNDSGEAQHGGGGQASTPPAAPLYDSLYAVEQPGSSPIVLWATVWLDATGHGTQVLLRDLDGLGDDIYCGRSVTNACEELCQHIAQRLIPPTVAESRWFLNYPFAGGAFLECLYTPPGTFDHVTWRDSSPAELRRLTGQPITHLPPPAQLSAAVVAAGAVAVDYRTGHDVVIRDVASLPLTRPFRCQHFKRFEAVSRLNRTAGRWYARIILKRLTPNDECDFYHGGDWRFVAQASVQIAEQLGSHLETHDILPLVASHARSPWEEQALYSLLADPIVLNDTDGYINGQHRSCALRYASARTVVIGL